MVNEQLGIQEIEIIINCSSKDETVQKIVSSLSVIDMKNHYLNMGISALIHQIFQTLILLFISHFQVHGKPLLTFFIMAVLGLPFCF